MKNHLLTLALLLFPFCLVAEEMTAIELIEAYSENKLAAEDRFKGKQITVVGVVESVSETITGMPYVSLEGRSALSYVQCVFPKHARQDLAQLKKGQRVKIGGTVQGKFVGIIMEGCFFRK